ncbi:hypothetical protein [Heyndrickxia ginsengihumi]|uniref:hypothetical protein n=1 Tax=Heyndrickxia ginsengihumi TaxID=363870 RepID=UPI003D2509D7
MRGLIVHDQEIQEIQEIQYLLKREMDEILFELRDDRFNQIVKTAMEERYQILFKLFTKVASSHRECAHYILPIRKRQKKG